MLAPAYQAALQKLCCTKPRAADVTYGDLRTLATAIRKRRLIAAALGGTKRENSAVVLLEFMAGAIFGSAPIAAQGRSKPSLAWDQRCGSVTFSKGRLTIMTCRTFGN